MTTPLLDASRPAHPRSHRALGALALGAGAFGTLAISTIAIGAIALGLSLIHI